MTPWTAANQAPLSMEFSSKDTGLPFPSSRDLLDPGIEPQSPALQTDSLPTGLPGNTMCILWNEKMRNYVGVGN